MNAGASLFYNVHFMELLINDQPYLFCILLFYFLKKQLALCEKIHSHIIYFRWVTYLLSLSRISVVVMPKVKAGSLSSFFPSFPFATTRTCNLYLPFVCFFLKGSSTLAENLPLPFPLSFQSAAAEKSCYSFLLSHSPIPSLKICSFASSHFFL